jgi:hypothetical protein
LIQKNGVVVLMVHEQKRTILIVSEKQDLQILKC